MSKERPVNLKLTTIRFPVTAITSILHRASGLLLFLFIPLLLWFVGYSLSSAHHFAELKATVDQVWVRIAVWMFLSALAYHVIAGIRHLLIDIHVGDSLGGGRFGAWTVIVVSALFIIAIAACVLFGFNKF